MNELALVRIEAHESQVVADQQVDPIERRLELQEAVVGLRLSELGHERGDRYEADPFAEAARRSRSTSARSRHRAAAGAINNMYYRPSRAYRTRKTRVQAGRHHGVFAVTNLLSYLLSIDMADPNGA